MALLLRAHAADEFLELRELLLDHADSRLILELERLLVEFLRGEGDDDLRPAEQDDIDRGHRHLRRADDVACASRRGCRRRPTAAPPACPRTAAPSCAIPNRSHSSGRRGSTNCTRATR